MAKKSDHKSYSTNVETADSVGMVREQKISYHFENSDEVALCSGSN
jgi:hypothetical protein